MTQIVLALEILQSYTKQSGINLESHFTFTFLLIQNKQVKPHEKWFPFTPHKLQHTDPGHTIMPKRSSYKITNLGDDRAPTRHQTITWNYACYKKKSYHFSEPT